jgi:hypothetical protein
MHLRSYLLLHVTLTPFLLISAALAQIPEALTTPEAVAEQLGAANEQLLVMVPTVRSQPLAEALRKAAVERGVRVYLLVSPEYVEEGGSFVPALAVLERVQTRLALVDRSFVIADRGEAAFLLEGEVLGESTQGFDTRETYALRDAATISTRGRLFEEVWLAAPEYISLIERMPFSSPGGAP